MNTFATQKLMSSHNFPLKNKGFGLGCFLQVTISAFFILIFPLSSKAQGTFRAAEFTVQLTAEFEQLESKAAIMVLRHKALSFPTFNVISAPGPWPYAGSDLRIQGQRIMEDYQLVGLKSAEIISSKIVEIDSMPSLLVELRYTTGTASMFSQVWVVALSDRHLIFTAVYKEPADPSSRQLINELLSSIRFAPSFKAPKSDSENSSSFSTDALLGVISIFLISAVCVCLWRFKRCR